MLRVILRHATLAVAFLALLVGVGEIALRGYVHVQFGVEGKSIGRWEADPVVGARMAAHVYDHRMETNNEGFRGKEDVASSRDPGSLQVVVYGGSTALCWNLKDEETWPRRLEDRLRRRSGREAARVQVLNGGDINWSIGHVLNRAKEELPRLRPDFVLLYSGINEVGNRRLLEAEGMDFETKVADGATGLSATSFPQAGWWGRHSLFYRAIQGRIIRPLVREIRSVSSPNEWEQWQQTSIGLKTPAEPPDSVTLDHYLRTLDELAELCHQCGSRLVFVVQARGPRTIALDHLTAFSRAGAGRMRDRGEWVVDAQRVVDDQTGTESLFTGSGMHYSALGAEEFAEFLANEIAWPLPRSDEETPRPGQGAGTIGAEF